jgi:hypothetical protein
VAWSTATALRAAFFTMPSRLPAAILPLHCIRVPLAGYCSPHQVGHGCRRAPCVCFRCGLEVVSKCFIYMLRMLQWL